MSYKITVDEDKLRSAIVDDRIKKLDYVLSKEGKSSFEAMDEDYEPANFDDEFLSELPEWVANWILEQHKEGIDEYIEEGYAFTMFLELDGTIHLFRFNGELEKVMDTINEEHANWLYQELDGNIQITIPN